jgi:hypothetical protein
MGSRVTFSAGLSFAFFWHRQANAYHQIICPAICINVSQRTG